MRFFLQSAFLSAIQNIYKAIKNLINRFTQAPSQPSVSDAVQDQTPAKKKIVHKSTSNETSALEKTTADRLASLPRRLSPFDLSDLTTRIFQHMPLEENRWLRTVSKSFLSAWEYAAKLHLFHPPAIPSLGIDNGITLYDKQKEEIDYLMENKEAILEWDDVPEIRAAFNKLAAFKENQAPIAFYARETHLNTINEFIIRGSIAAAQDEPDQSHVLDCDDCHLTRFPERVLKDKALEGFWAELTMLSLDNNRLHILPDAIGLLNALQKLHVSGNNLSILPSTIGQLSNLVELKVCTNKLEVLPDTIGKLSSLEILEVSSNSLSCLPETIGDLTALIDLFADLNPLHILPDTIGKLNKLQILDVSCTYLHVLPNTIGQLKMLKYLRVNSSKLIALPDTIIECAALEQLSVVQNYLCNLPAQLREDILVDSSEKKVNRKACLADQKPLEDNTIIINLAAGQRLK
ncbi:MAG: hypothetical protein JSS07_03035 [Proteobacteria bacterium]|nr:hypothetical protein [Pseudomonadota bacterium]